MTTHTCETHRIDKCSAGYPRAIMNRSKSYATIASTAALLVFVGLAQAGLAQTGTNPLTIFKNYFVTGDYVVAGWVEKSSDGTYATGTISVPDGLQPQPNGVVPTVPKGAIVVAAYLYWATVEGNQSSFVGQRAFFNGYQIVGNVLGNPNSPTSWSSGGCSGSNGGSKTIRFYRADVRPYLPIDTTTGLPVVQNPPPVTPALTVKIADSGSNGNTQPNALGATLVVIYRVLNPPATLNAIVLYDGSYAPFNTAPNVSQQMVGFYQPSNTTPIAAKLTHIVANGQPNKGETVSFGPDPKTFTSNNVLPSLYTATFGPNSPPFPGVYGTWDNVTWNVSGLMTIADTSETTTIVPAPTGSGCVDWGAMILSTTVQDSDGDGLLDVWEGPTQGYTDAVSGNFVALPGANPLQKDIFVELDYLVNYNADGTVQHSHLPKQAALDAVGNAFANQKPQGINVHFDVGNVYQGDPFVIPNGTGGNSIPESALLCTDNGNPPLCPFPGQAAIAWKGGLVFARDTATMPGTNPPAPLGNFQAGRQQSYHYVLSGHSLGEPRSFWSTYGTSLADPTAPQLVSIVNSGTTATVTLQTPVLLSQQNVTVYPKPGDCPNALIVGCSDANSGRVTILGSLIAPFVPGPNPQPAPPLNGTYAFNNAKSTTSPDGTLTTTTFTITTSGVSNGTYNFSNEPQLAVSYLGPDSSSGHSDFGGGGDSLITLGLWGADDVANCQPDPTQPPGPGYCNNQVGTLNVQTGTLLHEMGHSLTLTHGGAYYNNTDPANASVATYEMNCKPNYVSVMSYLFQVRGFVDGGFDYSGQTMPPLNEAYPSLSESLGIGNDIFTGHSATHLTRWYSKPNAIDNQLQATTGSRYARAHCDGTPLTSADVPGVRVNGTVAPGGNFSAPLDWNNDLVVPDLVTAPPGPPDINYNGNIGDSPFSGFNDWQILNPTPAGNSVALQQMSARWNAFGSSGAGGTKISPTGGTKISPTGGVDNDGGGAGTKISPTGGTKISPTGGIDQSEDSATATVDTANGLTCTISQGGVPGCVGPSTALVENAKSVPLTWFQTSFGQIRRFDVYRAVGSFPTHQQVLLNLGKFTDIKTLNTGTPPPSTYTDPNVKNGTTYTYFVTETNKQGATSGESDPLVVTIKF